MGQKVWNKYSYIFSTQINLNDTKGQNDNIHTSGGRLPATIRQPKHSPSCSRRKQVKMKLPGRVDGRNGESHNDENHMK